MGEKWLKTHIKSHKIVLILYLVLGVIAAAELIFALFRGNIKNAVICALTLTAFLLPAIIKNLLGIYLPGTIEAIFALFVFGAEILGEMHCFYVKYECWDSILHIMNGFLFAAIGFGLADMFSKNKCVKFKLPPLYVTLAALCISVTVGVLWEFFEFGCDMLLHTDMQKDTVLHIISSVLLDETQSNKPVIIGGINDVIVNGEPLGVGGYIDVGLIDTMKDLAVNFVGAAIFCVIGFIYLKSRGENKFTELFIPTIEENGDRDIGKTARKAYKYAEK